MSFALVRRLVQPGQLPQLDLMLDNEFVINTADKIGYIRSGSSLITLEFGASAGGGTVTSVGATVSGTGLSVSPAAITTSGTFTFTLSTNLQAWSGITTASKLDSSHAGTGGTAHALATGSVSGFMSAAQFNKLAGIADNANNYVHPTGFTNAPGTALTGASVISRVLVNANGHVTGVDSRTLTLGDLGYTAYVHPTGFTSVPASALTGASVISQVTVNGEGHVTGVSTRNLTAANIGAAASSHVLDSSSHTISGKTAGQALIATSATTFAFVTISGDATLSASGVITIANLAVTDGKIANATITNAKLANVATQTIKGRTTSGSGSPEDLSAAQVRAILNVADGANNYVHPTGFANAPGTALTGASVISRVLVNTNGHVTGVDTRTLTLADLGYIAYNHPVGFNNAPTTALTGANVISRVLVNSEGHVTGVDTRALTAGDVGAAATSHVLDSSSHTISGKTAGQALIATSPTTFAFVTVSGDATLSASGVVTIANLAITDGKIANATITNAKLANVATQTIKGRNTAGSGSPEDLTATQVRSILNVADGANNYVHPTGFGNAPATALTGTEVIRRVLVNANGHVTGAETQALQITDFNIAAGPLLLGRFSTSAGAVQNITIGGGLSLSTGGVLSSTGTTGAAGANTQVQYNSSGTFAGSADFTFVSGTLFVPIFEATDRVRSNIVLSRDSTDTLTVGNSLASNAGSKIQFFNASGINGASVNLLAEGTSPFSLRMMRMQSHYETPEFFDGSTWRNLLHQGSPPGSPGEVIFNNSNTFGTNPNFTYTTGTGLLRLGNGITTDPSDIGGVSSIFQTFPGMSGKGFRLQTRDIADRIAGFNTVISPDFFSTTVYSEMFADDGVGNRKAIIVNPEDTWPIYSALGAGAGNFRMWREGQYIDLPSFIPVTAGNPIGSTLRLYSRLSTVHSVPAVNTAGGIDLPLSYASGFTHKAEWIAVDGVSTVSAIGTSSPLVVGSFVPESINSGLGFYHNKIKTRVAATAASTTAIAAIYSNTASYFRGSTSQGGGFYAVAEFGHANGLHSTHRFAVGLKTGVAAPTDVNPSTLNHSALVGYDNTDSNFQFMCRAAAVATKVDTGIPKPSTVSLDWYRAEIYCDTGGTVISFRLTNLRTKATFTSSISSNLPAEAVAMSRIMYQSSGGTVSSQPIFTYRSFIVESP